MPEIRIYARGIRNAKFAALTAAVLFFFAVIFAPALPERVVPWWNEGQCWWFNGTIEDKWTADNDGMRGTTDYLFLVNGTLNELIESSHGLLYTNETTAISVIVHGGPIDYAMFNVGDHYNGYACDTMTLREAVANGTIEFLLWAGI